MIKSLGKATDEELGLKQGSPEPSSGGFVGGASDLLKSIGLSAIPTLGSAVVDAGTAITGGDPTKGNVFLSEQEKRKMVGVDDKGNVTDREAIAKTLGRQGAGMASWAMPLGTTARGFKAVGELVGRGAVSGGLQSISQEDAGMDDVTSGALLSGSLNLALPGISRLLKTTAFKGATGKSLGAIEKIEEKAGHKLTATTREGMKGQLKDMQSGLLSNLKDLMDNGGTMSRKEVSEYLDNFLDPQNELYQRLGPSEKKAAKMYINQLKSNLDDILGSFKDDVPGAISKPGYYGGVAGKIEGTEENALGPFYTFMKSLENDIPQSFWDKLKNFSAQGSSAQPKIAAELRKFLRESLSKKSANPKEFEALVEARKIVGGMQADIADEGLSKSVKELLGKTGLPLGIPGAVGLATSNPIISIPVGVGAGLMAVLEKYPQLAPMLRNLLDNPKTAALGDTLIRIITGTSVNPESVSQQSPESNGNNYNGY